MNERYDDQQRTIDRALEGKATEAGDGFDPQERGLAGLCRRTGCQFDGQDDQGARSPVFSQACLSALRVFYIIRVRRRNYFGFSHGYAAVPTSLTCPVE